MAEPLQESKDRGSSADVAITDFISRLSEEQRMLIVLKSQLYDGRWEAMLDDLKNGLAGKPYIFKLANRIKDDIARIELLQAFEKKYSIDLSNFVEL